MARGRITLVSSETSAGKSTLAIGQAKDRCKLTHQIEVVEHNRDPSTTCVCRLARRSSRSKWEHDEVSQRLCADRLKVNWLLTETGEIGPTDLQFLAAAAEEPRNCPFSLTTITT